MIDSLRKDIRDLVGNTHSRDNLALLFNRMCPGIDEHSEYANREAMITALTGGYEDNCLKMYRRACKSRQQMLENDPDTVCFEMRTTAPLIVGKGDQNVNESGITLQHPYGTPVIPGTAVKGVVSSWAHENGGGDWAKSGLAAFSGKFSLLMFGGLDDGGNPFAGCLDFLDAWWVPEKAKPFAEDIVNVHHRAYYQGDNPSWPAGMESPVPNKYIVVAPGEKFVFAVRGARRWRDLAVEMIRRAASDRGFGAITGSGYGRMEYVKSAGELLREIAGYDDAKLAEFFRNNKSNPVYDAAFAAEAARRAFADVLAPLFRKYRPAVLFLEKLRRFKELKWKNARDLYKNEFAKSFKNSQPKREDAACREIYNLCLPLLGSDHEPPEWLAKMAPSARELLADKGADEIISFVLNYSDPFPSRHDFIAAVKELDLEEDDKELVLLELGEE